MKKLFCLLGLFLTTACYANNNISANFIGNTCSPSDGHAIYLTFKDSSDIRKSINISVWKWRTILPSLQNSFTFNSSNSSNGNMNICYTEKDNKHSCTIQDGTLTLTQPYYSFKLGDIVEGTVVINKPSSLNFTFKHTVAPPTKNMVCG